MYHSRITYTFLSVEPDLADETKFYDDNRDCSRKPGE
jgi:hypothetical protein